MKDSNLSEEFMKDTKTVTIHFENAVARVHIPDLSDAERARRMKLIGTAAAQLLSSREKQK